MPKPVLVIDHDKNDLANISRYLKSHGYVTITSSKAEKGISLFFENLPGIVFINTLMPTINGTMVAKRLKSSHEGMRTPIFMLSPLVSGSARSEFHNWSDGIVKKPIQLGDVLYAVERHLGPGDPDLEDEDDDRESPDDSTEVKDTPIDDSNAEDDLPEDSNGHRVLTQGHIDEIDMLALVGSMAREKMSGRLEIRSEDHSISVLWESGFIVGLYSSNLLADLEKQEKLSRMEALAIRRRYREEGIDIIAGLRDLKFSPENLIELESDWRTNQLRGFISLKTGAYRLVDGPIKKSISIDPFLPVHFTVKNLYDMGRLQSLIEEQTVISGRYYWAQDDPKPEEDDTQLNHLINDIHAACVRGATLGELFTLSTDPTCVLSALFALLTIGRVTQNPKGAVKSKIVKPIKAVIEEVKKTVDEPEPFIAEPDLPPLADPAHKEKKKSASPPPPESTRPKAPTARKPSADKKVKTLSEPKGADRPAVNSIADTQPNIEGDIIEPANTVAVKEEIIINEPLSKEEVVRRGDEFMKQNTFSRAQECYLAIAEYDNDDPEIMVKAARATYRNKFLDKYDRLIESVHYCKKAISAKPTFIPAYITLMRIFEDENSYHLVRNIAAKALEHSPGNEEIDRKLKQMERSLARGQ